MKKSISSITLMVAAIMAGALVPFLPGCSKAVEHKPAVSSAVSGTIPMVAARMFPPKNLRGYGRVSGKLWVGRGGERESILEITAESVGNAQLTQAKYLSDLRELPGVSAMALPTGRGKLSAWHIRGQGDIAAVRSGKQVLILAATDSTGLVQLYEHGLAANMTINGSTAQVPVPMYLNRWDRYGFRFYYRPWETPPKQVDRPVLHWHGKPEPIYNPLNEFKFARREDDSGMVFWDGLFGVGNCEGLCDETWWNWALKASVENNLPIGINTSASGQCWLFNRYPGQVAWGMPEYCGASYGVIGRPGDPILSRNSTTAADVQLAELQQSIRSLVSCANITSWLEPHGEIPQDIMLDYGPAANRGFRRYLQLRYKTLAAVSRRWTGQADAIDSWKMVKVPQVASFLGWGPQAVDLTGRWRIKLLSDPAQLTGQIPAVPALKPRWYASDFNDRRWPTMTAPGDDQAMFLPQAPAIYRRSFKLSAAWLGNHKKVWLYVWDLDKVRGQPVIAYVNGRKIGQSMCMGNRHWGAYPATGVVKAGTNQVTLYLPTGHLNYRVYLSGHAPVGYPNLGAHQDAKWVDFIGWVRWAMARTIRHGAEMIRQVDPNRDIVFPHPDDYSGRVQQICREYGGEFHNTGYMAGFWADYNSMIMASAGLPTSAEPGGPAVSVPDLQRFMGRWWTEGIEGIDYFIHIGDILWHPGRKAWFIRHLKLIKLVGKYHLPKAQVALLFSDHAANLIGYPWSQVKGTNPGCSYWGDLQGTSRKLLPLYPRDGVTQNDFANGIAEHYQVIIDTGTPVMSKKLIRGIKRYVANGGTFITEVWTGESGTRSYMSWPIGKLSGYKVVAMNTHAAGKRFVVPHAVPAAHQKYFAAQNWQKAMMNVGGSVEMKPIDSDCQNLMMWSNGTVAVGMRRIGKGKIIRVGGTFWRSGGHVDLNLQMLVSILDALGVKRVPASAPGVLMRHYISNNGLYDVWMMWNRSDRVVRTDLTLTGRSPQFAIDVRSGREVPMESSSGHPALLRLRFRPRQTRAFLTPRNDVTEAAASWLALQRQWWQGTTRVTHVLKVYEPRFSRSLMAGWAFKPLVKGEHVQPMTVAGYNDGSWPRMRIGIWNVPNYLDVHRGLFRRTFTIPKTWTDGRKALWVHSFFSATFMDFGRIFLDGKAVMDWHKHGFNGTLGSDFKPGSNHVLAIEIKGHGSLEGCRGNVWLTYTPKPSRQISLAGLWMGATDFLRYDHPVQVPGLIKGIWPCSSMQRSVKIPQRDAGWNIVLHTNTRPSFLGIIFNGRYLPVGGNFNWQMSRMNINVTPWVHFGGENQIVLLGLQGDRNVVMKSVSLRLYRRGVYP